MSTSFATIKHTLFINGLKLLIKLAPSATTPMSFVGAGSTAQLSQHIAGSVLARH